MEGRGLDGGGERGKGGRGRWKETLPCIEEAWSLPTPVELTSRQSDIMNTSE